MVKCIDLETENHESRQAKAVISIVSMRPINEYKHKHPVESCAINVMSARFPKASDQISSNWAAHRIFGSVLESSTNEDVLQIRI